MVLEPERRTELLKRRLEIIQRKREILIEQRDFAMKPVVPPVEQAPFGATAIREKTATRETARAELEAKFPGVSQKAPFVQTPEERVAVEKFASEFITPASAGKEFIESAATGVERLGETFEDLRDRGAEISLKQERGELTVPEAAIRFSELGGEAVFAPLIETARFLVPDKLGALAIEAGKLGLQVPGAIEDIKKRQEIGTNDKEFIEDLSSTVEEIDKFLEANPTAKRIALDAKATAMSLLTAFGLKALGAGATTLAKKAIPVLKAEAKAVTKKVVTGIQKVKAVPGKVKGVVEEATGTARKLRKTKVISRTKETFEGATAQKESFDIAKQRSKETSRELLREFGKQEEILGKKVVADFGDTSFANTRSQKFAIDKFLNSTDNLIDKGNIARNVQKVSELLPAKGQSRRAATELRKFLLKNTSSKYTQLNDKFASTSRAINILDDNIKFKTAINIQELPSKLKSQVVKIKNLELGGIEPSKVVTAKFDLLNKLKADKSAIGKAMDQEIKALTGKTISGDKFRVGLESELKKQNISLTREPIARINKRDLEEIKKAIPDDTRVKQLIQDEKILKSLEPRSVAFDLQSQIFNKQGVFQNKKVVDLLIQDQITPEGELLKNLLPKELVADIVKKRLITPERAKQIAKIAIGASVPVIGASIVF